MSKLSPPQDPFFKNSWDDFDRLRQDMVKESKEFWNKAEAIQMEGGKASEAAATAAPPPTPMFFPVCSGGSQHVAKVDAKQLIRPRIQILGPRPDLPDAIFAMPFSVNVNSRRHFAEKVDVPDTADAEQGGRPLRAPLPLRLLCQHQLEQG